MAAAGCAAVGGHGASGGNNNGILSMMAAHHWESDINSGDTGSSGLEVLLVGLLTVQENDNKNVQTRMKIINTKMKRRLSTQKG